MFDKTLSAYAALSGKSEEEQLEFIETLCEFSKPYTFDGMCVLGKVSRVIDGDSCVVNFPIDGKPWSFSMRLLGIDCPEMRTRDLREKEMGLKAKKLVESLVLDRIVAFHLGDFDKYGRLLGRIKTRGDVDVADHLVENNLARPYTGGKKEPW